ncbi:MAG: hypothetical protein K6T91_10220 [Firmicutes bacterium]|nr:hypothetical protein [Bacillota bacterium]
MRRLLFGLVALMFLSHIPQVSDQFKEEQQGIDAAYQKVIGLYSAVSKTYDNTRKDVNAIQQRLAQTKEDVDKSLAYTEKAGNKMSEALRLLEVFINRDRDTTETPSR